MLLAEIEMIDDPYETDLLTEDDLKKAPALYGADEGVLAELARIGQGVVEAILNLPADTEGNRHCARAAYRETVLFERDQPSYTLGRSPASLTAVALDGVNVLDQVRFRSATGIVSLKNGVWPCGLEAVFEYEGGWRSPAQAANEAPADYGPDLPATIIQAAVRAAQIAFSSLSRADVALKSLTESVEDMGDFTTSFMPPPVEAGQDAEIFRLLAPWRRLMLP